MGWDGVLLLWCAAWGAVALVGAVRSLAGVTEAQRTVRLAGRIRAVGPVRDGGSRIGGIPVTVVYRDPASGREVVVEGDDGRGETLTAVWVGREIGVSHPRGRPQEHRFANAPERPARGLAGPAGALFALYAGLVALAAVRWAWPWALVGTAGPWALLGLWYLPGAVRDRRAKRARLAGTDAVPGRIVAVFRDVRVDEDDGSTLTTLTPVLAFTTRDGTAVTAHCTAHLADPARARGREVTVHHPPGDPAGFTLDPAADRRSWGWDLAVHVIVLVLLAATAATGVVLLRR
ncbi:DUF3592 domain-containing protein [Kitasatospora sp. NA04385]|uniref:DUF3592 domain-containing protein n=1 Tax=Kitasatospora sp. NA04385 TaxID=2742135 RepID=UPI00159221F4|nr:DUF3592 domain-containing protein [Kitasatospora sp. NA04385]QKW19190.1 DUF3592 domain-containing protein [Kitasatospora sp. NA04385]